METGYFCIGTGRSIFRIPKTISPQVFSGGIDKSPM